MLRILPLGIVASWLTASLGAVPGGHDVVANSPGFQQAPEKLRKTKHVDPVYPKEASRAGLAQDVVLDCRLDASGEIVEAVVIEGVPPLTEAAVQAVRKWRFEPVVVGGEPTPVRLTVTIAFKMKSVRFRDLIDSLDSANEHIRAAAARNLGGLRPAYGIRGAEIHTAARALEKMAQNDASAAVRETALRALSNLDGRPLPPELK